MSISSVNPNVTTAVNPRLPNQTPGTPGANTSQVTSAKDADGDNDGDTSAKAAAEKRGGVDVKG